MPGFTGDILEVNLKEGKFVIRKTDQKTQKKFVGGVGLAAKILFDETRGGTDPFSEGSLLVFMTGPLTGTSMPFSGRHIVAGISPLTSIWGEGHVGGDFGDELKHAGFDGMIVKGRATSPVYIWIHNKEVEIRDATHLWGMDTYETTDLVRKETLKKAGIAVIGPAGEKMVRYAAIMHDGRRARAAARGGLGALMGSKNLKAVAVRGTLPAAVYDKKKFDEGVARILRANPFKSSEEKHAFTPRLHRRLYEVGGVPIKNWLLGTLDNAEEYFRYEEAYESKPDFCRHCPSGCGTSRLSHEGERWCAHVEVFGPLGFNCLIVEGDAIQSAYSACNKYGLDCISTGGVIGYAMELVEKGLIKKSDIDGIELTWGNSEAVAQLIEKIAHREGFGKLLGEGVKRIAEYLGGMSHEYAIHGKGLEFPAHDPRASFARALNYATSNIGASHYEGGNVAASLEDYLVIRPEDITRHVSPELGYRKRMSRFQAKGKGRLVAEAQNYGCMMDSLVVCAFAYSWHRVQPSQFAELLNSATGWEFDTLGFLKTGERIFNLKRIFNVRRGISRKDDVLPSRFTTHSKGGGAGNNLPFMGLMLNEYYSYRSWSEEGIPTREKLDELSLNEYIAFGVKGTS